jgi:WD40 repeat protein
MPGKDADLPDAPFVGLRPYEREDIAIFFGRQREAELLIDKIFSARLTLLYGQSGLGKSSLLRALVIPELERRKTFVRYFDAWGGELPATALALELVQAASSAGVSDPDKGAPTLVELVRLLAHATGKTVVLILDQFEEFLTAHGGRLDPLKGELAALVRTPGLDVRVVIAMREEYLAALEPFRREFLQLFESTYRLEPLCADGLRDAIEKPIQRFDGSCEPGFVDLLIADLATQSPTARNDQPMVGVDRDVELPMLQLVCRQLWEVVAARKARAFTIAVYRAQGKADGILDSYVQSVMPARREDQVVTASLLKFLAPPSGLKMSYSVQDLVDPTGFSAERLERELDRLEGCRILRGRKYQGGKRFELLHDAYINILRPWVKTVLEKVRSYRARRKAALWGGGVIVFFAAAAALLVSQQMADSANDRLAAVHLDRARIALLGGNYAAALEDLRESCIRKCDDDVLRFLIPQAFAGLGVPLRLADPDKQLLRFDLVGDNVRFVERSQHETDEPSLRVVSRRAIPGDNLDGPEQLEPLAYVPEPGYQALPRTLHRERILEVEQPTEGAAVVRLWNIATDRQEWAKPNPLGEINKGMVSHDGARALTFGPAGAVIWDIETGRSLILGGDTANALLSPDGQWAVTLGFDETARLWATRDGKKVADLPHESFPEEAAFSKDGKRLATATVGEVRIWTLSDLAASPIRVRGFSPITFDPSGTKIAVAGDSAATKVWIWDLAWGFPELAATLYGHRGRISGMHFDSEGNRVLTSSQDGTAKLWDVGTGDLLVDIAVSDGTVKEGYFFNDRFVVTVDDAGQVLLWRAATGKLLWRRTVDSDLEMAMFDPTKNWIASAAASSHSRLWAITSGDEVRAFVDGANDNAWVDTLLRFSPDGQSVATAGRDGSIRLWEVASGRLIRTLKHSEKPNASLGVIEFDPSGRFLLSASQELEDSTVKLWDLKTGDAAQLIGHDGTIKAAAFKPGSGELVVTAGADGSAIVWDTKSATMQFPPLEAHKGELYDVRFDPKGRRLVTTADDGMASIWDTRSGKLLGTLRASKGTVWSSDFDASAKRLATGGDDGKVKVWDLADDVATGEPHLVLEGHHGPVKHVRFSPDQNSPILTSASEDGTVKIWGARDGELLVSLAHRAPVKSAVFDATGSMLLTASGKVLALWDVRAEDSETEALVECLSRVAEIRATHSCTESASEVVVE